jgi:hypothetical protein
MSTQVEALLLEREGYLRRGLKDRVALVDAQLAHYGIAVETASADHSVETASRSKPKPRRVADAE